jgi:hypothetical protein
LTERPGDRRKHLIVRDTASAESFTSPAAGGKKFRTKPVNRGAHGQALKQQLERALAEIERRRSVVTAPEEPRGFYLEFASPPDFLLKLESLEYSRSGIELATTRQVGNQQFATVFVPQGKISFFVKRVEKYLTEQHARGGRPKNKDLIESIAAIRLAVAESFWSDPPDLLPAVDTVLWWEVWLRGQDTSVLERFKAFAAAADIQLAADRQVFPDRIVILVRASLQQFATALDVLDVLAELRRVKQIGSFFTRVDRREERDWVRDLQSRLVAPSADAPAVTVLDTGVSHGHPLLAPLLDPADLHTCRSGWGTHDHHGHGTQMAGVAVFGDLVPFLVNSASVLHVHRLESVKVLPPSGSNAPHLYGSIIADAASLVEIEAPDRRRVFSMSIGADASDRGEPSAWSAEIDKLAAAVDGGEPRLFVICAGNAGEGAGLNYPEQNYTDGILDPGHAWNALTVGAYTERTEIDEPHFAGWSPVAPPGAISPATTTSCTWAPQWPIKPDVVMEGGNMAVSPHRTEADAPDSLGVLTTYYQFASRMFTATGDTSAATAAAARYAAMIHAEYPQLWPEAVRGLLVDSAEWTPAMRRELDATRNSRELSFLLRTFGFGVPNVERALFSAGNALTLIAQDELQPFTGNKSNEMNLHRLPWPRAALQQLGEMEVELRVTLSYFIEPNPARRGWKKRHSYASHGLRFAVQKPTESIANLRKRVNKDARDEDEGAGAEADSEGWLLKQNLRGRGSLHHDRWHGTAAALAPRSHIAVYPAIGWWRERQTLNRSESRARYALVVTIRTPPTGIDIYQPVAAQIGVMVPVAT